MFPQEVISDVIFPFLQSRELSKMRAVSPACKDTIDEMERFRHVRDLVTIWKKAPQISTLPPEEFVKLPDDATSSLCFRWFGSECSFIMGMAKHGEFDLCVQHNTSHLTPGYIFYRYGHNCMWGLTPDQEKIRKIAVGDFRDVSSLDERDTAFAFNYSIINGFKPPVTMINGIKTYRNLIFSYFYAILFNYLEMKAPIKARFLSLGYSSYPAIGFVTLSCPEPVVIPRIPLISLINGAAQGHNIRVLRQLVKAYRSTYGDPIVDEFVEFDERAIAIIKLLPN